MDQLRRHALDLTVVLCKRDDAVPVQRYSFAIGLLWDAVCLSATVETDATLDVHTSVLFRLT